MGAEKLDVALAPILETFSLRSVLIVQTTGTRRKQCAERRKPGGFSRETRPLTDVPFVGGQEIGPTLDAIRCDGVWKVHAHHGPLRDIEFARARARSRTVFIAAVQSRTGGRMRLEAEAPDVHENAVGDVELGDRVVLLERDPGRSRVVGHGDVLGLEVLRDRRAGTEDANARVQQRAVERRRNGRSSHRTADAW